MNRLPTSDRNRVLVLSAAVGGGTANPEEKAELTALLKEYPDLSRDSRLVVEETKTFEDDSFMETCLRVLFGACSDQELADFARTCRQDRTRWHQYCRVRHFLEHVGRASAAFSKMPESKRQPSPKTLDSIWQKFREIRDKPSRSQRNAGRP